MVDGHVAEDAEAEFGDFGVVFFEDAFVAVFEVEDFGELEDCFFA